MKRKDILMLTASMMGIASGWAVLNDQVYAMTDEEPLPRFEEAVSEDKNIADDSIVLPEAPAEPTAVTEQSADTELADPAAIDGKAANLTDKSSPENPLFRQKQKRLMKMQQLPIMWMIQMVPFHLKTLMKYLRKPKVIKMTL